MLEKDIYFVKQLIFKKIKPKSLSEKFHKILFSKIENLILNDKELIKIYNHNKEVSIDDFAKIYITFVNKKIKNLLTKFKKNKINIIFISEKVYFNQIRINNFFNSKFIDTASISINNKNIHHNGFKINLSLSIFEIFILLSKSKNFKIFSQGWLFRYHQSYLIDSFKNSNIHIVEMMDLNSFWFPKYKNKKIERSMKIVWGHDAKLNHELQLFSENYLYNNCDKVLFPGSINHVEDLKLNNKYRFEKYFEFGPYPQKKYFAKPVIKKKYKPENINLVFAGGIVPIEKRRTKKIYADAQFVSTAKIILSQNYNLTVFNNPLQLKEKYYKTVYKPHYKLMNRYKNNYKFLKGFVGKEATRRLSSYDLGLMIYDFNKTTLIGENHFKNMIPTKFFLYMEACLPVLVSSRWVTVSQIVQRYNLGCVVSEQNIYNLKNIIKKIDIAQLKKNVSSYRNLFKDFSQFEFLLN